MAQKLTALPFFPSGLAHAGVGIKGVADKNPTAAVMTVGDKATSVKGIFQQQAKTVANLCAAARPDLTVRRNSVLPQEKSITPTVTESLRSRAPLLRVTGRPERADPDLAPPHPLSTRRLTL
jgi:hypothetical protein